MGTKIKEYQDSAKGLGQITICKLIQNTWVAPFPFGIWPVENGNNGDQSSNPNGREIDRILNL